PRRRDRRPVGDRARVDAPPRRARGPRPAPSPRAGPRPPRPPRRPPTRRGGGVGDAACAALILKGGQGAPTLAELQEFLEREGVAKYMWPESIEVFDEFPRTPSLKVVKHDVVQQIVARATVATPV